MTAETTTADSPGNTSPGFRGRAFLFTLNEVHKYEDLKEAILNLKSCDYFLSAKEIAPTTGHEHIHIYTHFTNSYKISKKILKYGAHIDICKGTPQQNIKYVKKDGNILDEIGDEPHQGFHTVANLKNIENPDELYWNEYSTWQKIKQSESNEIDIREWKKNIKVYYIQGPSGIGKSNKAKEIVLNKADKYGHKINMVKYENGFWNGWGSSKVAIYDDFRDSHMKPSEFINFIDYNKHPVNIKGGCAINDKELIIITSVQRLDDIYKNIYDEPRKQWERRIKVIDMYNDNIDDYI